MLEAIQPPHVAGVQVQRQGLSSAVAGHHVRAPEERVYAAVGYGAEVLDIFAADCQSWVRDSWQNGFYANRCF